MSDTLTDQAAEYRRVAAVYTDAVAQLEIGLQSANTAGLKKHQQEAIDLAKGRAGALESAAAEIDGVLAELAWWRATYPDVKPYGA